MRMDHAKEAKDQRKLKLFIGVLAVILVAVIAAGAITLMNSNRAKDDAANQKQIAKEDVQRQAWQEFYKKRCKEYSEIRKLTVSTMTDPELIAKVYASPAATVLDTNKDGMVDITIDHPAIQREFVENGETNVSFDGQYAGNIRVGVLAGDKIYSLPENPNKKTVERPAGTHPMVYMSKDFSQISIVVKSDGESGEYDGYLYKVDNDGVTEVSHKFGVSERTINDKGDVDTPEEFKKFEKTYMPEGFELYKEKLNYEEDGKLKTYKNVSDFKDYLSTKGIMLGSQLKTASATDEKADGQSKTTDGKADGQTVGDGAGVDFWREVYRGNVEDMDPGLRVLRSAQAYACGYHRIAAKYNKGLDQVLSESDEPKLKGSAEEAFTKELIALEKKGEILRSWYCDINSDGKAEMVTLGRMNGKSTLTAYEYDGDKAVARGTTDGADLKLICALDEENGALAVYQKGSTESFAVLKLGEDGKLSVTDLGTHKLSDPERYAGFQLLKPARQHKAVSVEQ